MHFHSTLRERSELDLIHKRTDIKYSPAARFQQVFRIQRIRNFISAESVALVLNRNRELIRKNFEADVHFLAQVQLVSMLNGVRHRFPNRHPDPVRRILIKTHGIRNAVGKDLDQIEVVQGTAYNYVNLVGYSLHQAVSTRLGIFLDIIAILIVELPACQGRTGWEDGCNIAAPPIFSNPVLSYLSSGF